MSTTKSDESRTRNPFHDPLVTELIEDSQLYLKMFSPAILVGETQAIFQPVNTIVTGPQGSGKSMILNLIRYEVLSDWIGSVHGTLPDPLNQLGAFFGISINLVRANFHAFGRRSVSKATGYEGESLNAIAAEDFLSHFLFRELVIGLQHLATPAGQSLRNWLQIPADTVDSDMATELANWSCWSGYYTACTSLSALLCRTEERLGEWRTFLNANVATVPERVWETKTSFQEPMHSMGTFLSRLSKQQPRLPLFVLIDQYEVLPELNPTHGVTLQRVVNGLIKSRDPAVFYKIGARTHDWGRELRVWGAESRIEEQRDYVKVDLAELLMRTEDNRGPFHALAVDVAYKRVAAQGMAAGRTHDDIQSIFGEWDPHEESREYIKGDLQVRREVLLKDLTVGLQADIARLCGPDASPLDLKLAHAWCIQKLQRHFDVAEVRQTLSTRPWRRPWWNKERIGVALLQIASATNQKKRYYGWKTVEFLSGGNISAYLSICAEIWDMATKLGINPLRQVPLSVVIQTQGILAASDKWSRRDRNEQRGGAQRYKFILRIVSAIREYLLSDEAISNPGYSGFSVRETEIGDDTTDRAVRLLNDCVSWAILEERPHTSKIKGDVRRRKWYLHPLYSPALDIPYIRVKEPFYVSMSTVRDWIDGSDMIRFGPKRRKKGRSAKSDSSQMTLL